MAFKNHSPASRRERLRNAALNGAGGRRPGDATPKTAWQPARYVFVSYVRSDLLVAGALVKALQARGIKVVWDMDFPSRPLSGMIKKTVEDAACVIAVWSDASCLSFWVEGEAMLALENRKLVSVHVDGFDPKGLALQFKGLNCVPMSDMSRVCDSLAEHGFEIGAA